MSAEAPEETSPRPARADTSSDETSLDETSSNETSTDEAKASDAEVPARRPRAKKKPLPARRARKPATDDDDLDEAKVAPAPRDDRPAFTLRFPSDPALTALVTAFERGDYATVRRDAPRLAKETDQPEVREAAKELRRRLDPDPIAAYLLIAAGVLLTFLAAWFWQHPHQLPGP